MTEQITKQLHPASREMFLFIPVGLGDWYAIFYLGTHIESSGFETPSNWRKRKMHQDVKQQYFTMNPSIFFWQKQELFPFCNIQSSNNYYGSKKCHITTDRCNVNRIKIKPTVFHQTWSLFFIAQQIIVEQLHQTLHWGSNRENRVRVCTRPYTHTQGNAFFLWG